MLASSDQEGDIDSSHTDTNSNSLNAIQSSFKNGVPVFRPLRHLSSTSAPSKLPGMRRLKCLREKESLDERASSDVALRTEEGEIEEPSSRSTEQQHNIITLSTASEQYTTSLDYLSSTIHEPTDTNTDITLHAPIPVEPQLPFSTLPPFLTLDQFPMLLNTHQQSSLSSSVLPPLLYINPTSISSSLSESIDFEMDNEWAPLSESMLTNEIETSGGSSLATLNLAIWNALALKAQQAQPFTAGQRTSEQQHQPPRKMRICRPYVPKPKAPAVEKPMDGQEPTSFELPLVTEEDELSTKRRKEADLEPTRKRLKLQESEKTTAPKPTSTSTVRRAKVSKIAKGAGADEENKTITPPPKSIGAKKAAKKSAPPSQSPTPQVVVAPPPTEVLGLRRSRRGVKNCM
ncbi:hypothetical protein HDV05_006598 [Chytridiales sp. JEL 0842]|nr:hypothetical protein HDV05_006598 [Chytridiales sp. JEL 0842]